MLRLVRNKITGKIQFPNSIIVLLWIVLRGHHIRRWRLYPCPPGLLLRAIGRSPPGVHGDRLRPTPTRIVVLLSSGNSCCGRRILLCRPLLLLLLLLLFLLLLRFECQDIGFPHGRFSGTTTSTTVVNRQEIKVSQSAQNINILGQSILQGPILNHLFQQGWIARFVPIQGLLHFFVPHDEQVIEHPLGLSIEQSLFFEVIRGGS
mmetsp:Transcript_5587/g.15798  ORF Transcript_5587/g.15798 Transcript_5587/m.15798 type:complete len:205 (-) Transcript_5587:973-1587(-)